MQNDLLILIVDSDHHFREEIFNFLLSASYKHIDTADNFDQALVKIRCVTPDVVLLDDQEAAHEDRVETIAKINPAIRVIVMIDAGEKKQLRHECTDTQDYELIIKNTFSQNLLYMLRGSV